MNIYKFTILCLSNLYRYKAILIKSKTNFTIVKANLALSFLWKTSEGKFNADNVALTPSILEMADKLFDSGKYEECCNFLDKHKELNNIEVTWRLCRAMYNMAKEDNCDNKSTKIVVTKAFKLIESELKNYYDHYNVQKWYAILLDAKCSYEGRKIKLEQLNTVKKHLSLAVKINPNDASLLHMLGEMCYQVREIPWHQRVAIEIIYTKLPNYTYEEALEYFLKAEAAQPRFYSVNLLRLGCCYLKINKKDQAKYYLKLAASYPAKSNDDHQAKREAAEILKRLK